MSQMVEEVRTEEPKMIHFILFLVVYISILNSLLKTGAK